MSAKINFQNALVQSIEIPLSTGTINTPSQSVPPVVGRLVYDQATTSAYVGNGANWMPMSNDLPLEMGPVIAGSSGEGATIDPSNILQLETANATNPGIVSIAAQTFAGAKTFNDGLIIESEQGAGTTVLENRPLYTEGISSFFGVLPNIVFTNFANTASAAWHLQRVGRFVFVSFGLSTVLTMATPGTAVACPAGTISGGYLSSLERSFQVRVKNNGVAILASARIGFDGSITFFSDLDQTAGFTGTFQSVEDCFMYTI